MDEAFLKQAFRLIESVFSQASSRIGCPTSTSLHSIPFPFITGKLIPNSMLNNRHHCMNERLEIPHQVLMIILSLDLEHCLLYLHLWEHLRSMIIVVNFFFLNGNERLAHGLSPRILIHWYNLKKGFSVGAIMS